MGSDIIGFNEALKYLKKELNVTLESAGYKDNQFWWSARPGYNAPRSLRDIPVEAYITRLNGNIDTSFKLLALTGNCDYLGASGDDELGFKEYMEKYQETAWGIILEDMGTISNEIRELKKYYPEKYKKVVKEFRPPLFSTRATRNRLKEEQSKAQEKIDSELDDTLSSLVETAKEITRLMNEKVEFSDNAYIQIYAKNDDVSVNLIDNDGDLYFRSVLNPRWYVSSMFSASPPCEFNEQHPLVKGILNKWDSIELRFPDSISPELALNIKKGPSSKYTFKLKGPGVNKQALEDAVGVILGI